MHSVRVPRGDPCFIIFHGELGLSREGFTDKKKEI
jgi:hypothetical protein